MKQNEVVNISLELLLLNDLYRAKVIGDAVYEMAVKKLYETAPNSFGQMAKKEIA